MRVAIFSDIHGNAVAFETLYTELYRESFDQLVCLGDAIQGGPQPAEVVIRLRGLKCPVVMGNADAWLLTGQETGAEDIPDDPTGALRSRRRKMDDVRAWSFSQLSEADRQFIATFQPAIELPLGHGQNLLAFHGSPASFDELLWPSTPDAEFEAALGPHLPRLMTGGHTHLPFMRRIGGSQSFFFNPGSVGLAYSHAQPEGSFRADPWAEYAVLTIDEGRVDLEFRRVLYDPASLVAVYRASGRPHAEDMIAQYGV